MWLLSLLLVKACFKSLHVVIINQTSSDWSTAVTSHATVNSDAHSIQISSQNIRTMQACKQLQCNKAKLLEPASINGLHNTRVYATASLVSAYTNENLGGHIYTVTQQKVQQPADKPATFSHVQTTMPLNIKKHHGKP